MDKKKNSVKLDNNPLPYLIGSLILIFSIIIVYFIWNGNSLKENPQNNYYSNSATTADN